MAPSPQYERLGPTAIKPHSAGSRDHNQFVKDPVAHFRAIPWTNALLSDPEVLNIVISDRNPLPSGESNLVRRVLNTGTTVRACVTFLKYSKPPPSDSSSQPIPPLYQGGGPKDFEDPANPFLLFSALLDLGEDLQSYAGTMHGGLFVVLMDEVMGTAANFQSKHGAYTVSFTTNYKKPVALPQVVVVRGRVVRKDGKRKIWVRGSIEDKDGAVLGEGEGLWIEMGRNIGRSQL